MVTWERDGPHAGQFRGKLGRLLAEITQGYIKCLNDLGILPNPRSVLVHGPLLLQFTNGSVDLSLLEAPARIGLADIGRAITVATSSNRCLTVENETSFFELAKLQSGTLLICTSYPGRATLSLLRRLPSDMEYWHFGDSDEAGFEILRVLRDRSERNFQPRHISHGKVPFEQESLGPLRRLGGPSM